MRNNTLLASVILLATVILAVWRESIQPTPLALTPTLTGEIEYCTTCHADLAEISASHPVQTFGCVTCHGGERLALDKDLAHSSLRGGKNPSDLTIVEASCGGEKCHSGSVEQQRNHISRVTTSIQTTYAGAIAQIRYAFGAQPDLVARMGVQAVSASADNTGGLHKGLTAFDSTQETSPALQAFSQNCLFCHLSATPLSGEAYHRWTGCAACHSPSPSLENGPSVHRLTTSIPYTTCNTCHNRGNYDLRDMQFHPRSDQPTDRLHDYYQPIAQFTRCEWTLNCVDCHTRYEVMGDGNLYSNKKEIQYIQCKTCHGTLDELPLTKIIVDPNDLSLKLAFLNPVIDLQIGDTIIVTEHGEELWNIRQTSSGEYEQFSKADGHRFVFSIVKGTACLQKSDKQESRYCHQCHAVSR